MVWGWRTWCARTCLEAGVWSAWRKYQAVSSPRVLSQPKLWFYDSEASDQSSACSVLLLRAGTELTEAELCLSPLPPWIISAGGA